MFESHASIFLGIIAALTMHPMASGQGPTAVQTASEPAADLFPTLTNDLNALSIDVTQASDRMVAPIGDLTINSPNGRLIRLINKTSHSIKIAEMKISCGCVQAVNDGLSAQPGQALDIHFSLRPTLQTNTFRQMVSIRFDGPNESIIQLHLEGHVKNLVDVEPASLNFTGATESKSLILKPIGQNITLKDCKSTRRIIEIQKKQVLEDGRMLVEVTPRISAGQAVDILRITFEQNGQATTVEAPMLITGRTTARFIPLHLSFGSNSGIIRVIVVFAGDFVPSPGAEPSAIFKNNDGKELAPGGQDIAITRQSDRRFDVVFTAPPVRVKAGGVLAFSVDAREFLCPFSWEQ